MRVLREFKFSCFFHILSTIFASSWVQFVCAGITFIINPFKYKLWVLLLILIIFLYNAGILLGVRVRFMMGWVENRC